MNDEFSDIDLVSDVKELMEKNPDVRISPELKAKILAMDDDDLVLTKKKIEHGIVIIFAEKMTAEYIQKTLFGDKDGQRKGKDM